MHTVKRIRDSLQLVSDGDINSMQLIETTRYCCELPLKGEKALLLPAANSKFDLISHPMYVLAPGLRAGLIHVMGTCNAELLPITS